MIGQLKEVFQDDKPGGLRQVEKEVGRWKAKCEMANVPERPNTLDDTIQEVNPVLYPNVYTAVVILLVMSVSTVTAERSFIVMRRHGNT